MGLWGIFLGFLFTFNLFATMPTESSFPDRIGRFVLLKNACVSMGPPVFAPSDTDITIAAQAALIVTLNTCCTNVTNALTDLKDVADPRAASVQPLKARVTRVVNRVQSNRAWASKVPNVKMAADKLRGLKAPKATVPTAPSDPDAPPVKRDRGGQSYRDLEGYLGKLISTLGKCAAYDTGAPADITIAALTTLQNTLKTANDAVPAMEVTLRDAQIERLRIFQSKNPLPDGSASLRDRWVRIKKAVASQYGRGSAEYLLVRTINY